jgi:predicted DNA-binding protein (MmcQ/YjbR family)
LSVIVPRPDLSLNADAHRPAFGHRRASSLGSLGADHCAHEYQQLKEFCSRLSGANETLYGEPSNFLVYSVGGKKFAYFKTSEPERWRFSTRVTPDRFVELTDFPGVKPARYRGRFHWVTIVDVPRFPASYLTELVEWSYQKAFASLSKAKQDAIRASHA